MVILDATGGGTPTQGGALGGNAVLISYKTLANDGRIQTQVEDKAWQAYFSGTLLNERSGSLSVASGTLTMPSPSTSGYGGANAFAVTNDGTLDRLGRRLIRDGGRDRRERLVRERRHDQKQRLARRRGAGRADDLDGGGLGAGTAGDIRDGCLARRRLRGRRSSCSTTRAARSRARSPLPRR